MTKGERMANLLNCSACAAPLDLAMAKGGMVRCPYCGNTTLLANEKRDDATRIETANGSLGSLIDQSVKLAEVARLAREGNKIEAIRLYREITGCGLKEAKDAVEQMESGGAVSFTYSTVQAKDTSPAMPSFNRSQARRTARAGLGLLLLIAIFFILPFVIIFFATRGFGLLISTRSATAQGAIPAIAAPRSSTPASASTPAGLASVAFEFGSKGIGAGQFEDARSVAVGGEGNIYVGEYSGGRVQAFDSAGKFITQWMADRDSALLNLAADRKGNVYVVQGGKILRYEGKTGRLIDEAPKPDRYEYYNDVSVALDGSLYALTQKTDVVRISSSGETKIIVNLNKALNERVSFSKLAVDGKGTIYAIATFEGPVFKFAPDGRFIDRFGKADESGRMSPPFGIAVDGQGRVYISNTSEGVQVFDANGEYIGNIGGGEVVFGMAVNDRNELFTTQRNRAKIVGYALNR